MVERYFGVPQQVIRGGTWAKLKPSEQSLYICLLHDSERYSSRELRRTDAQITELIGLSSRAFCNARKKLQEHGLIRYRRSSGNVYVYAICNPETKLPWPGDPKLRAFYVKKGERLSSPMQSPSWPPTPSAPVRTQSAKPASACAIPEDRMEVYGVPDIFSSRE